MYKLNNSHVANCSYYNYKVCCDDMVSATLRSGSCNADEGEVISMYKPQNSHAAKKGYYTYKVCAKFASYPVECSIKTSCDVNETCVVSLYKQTNSHVATCNFYTQKVCCGKLSDLYVNQSSIIFNDTDPVVGDALLVNITVWNIGDTAAANVNVSCYDNGVYFDSYVINSIPPDPSMQTPRYAQCELTTDCPLDHNISIKVDPMNEIKEYNETNNEAWKGITLTDKLTISIDSPNDGQNVYRCSALNLNSTVGTYCGNPVSGYEVKWYNSTGLIASGEDSYWCIGSSDGLLGSETINVTVNKTGYVSGTNTTTINIINNPPNVGNVWYNVTPPEIHIGDAIQIACKVNDTHNYYCGASLISCTEELETSLDVNISVKRPPPYNDWSNVSASYEAGVFYRDYGTQAGYPLGYYLAVCSASDSDNAYKETSSQFLVYQNATISMFLNSTYYWWNEGVKVYGWAKEIDGDPIPSAEVTIKLSGTIMNTTQTDANGYYEGTFTTPSKIGNYIVVVNFTHPITEKKYGNATLLYVSPYYGGSESEMRRAKNIGCYEVPKFVQNPDGTIERVIVKVCVWK